MIPQRQDVRFDEWYTHKDAAYKFTGTSRGTSAVIRGSIDTLTPMLNKLNSLYKHRDRFAEMRTTLASVLESGTANDDYSGIIHFGDDRIRLIARCDDERFVNDGPFSGNKSYLELTHHEQYGGNHKRDPIIDSRAMLVSRVLQALDETMLPHE